MDTSRTIPLSKQTLRRLQQRQELPHLLAWRKARHVRPRPKPKPKPKPQPQPWQTTLAAEVARLLDGGPDQGTSGRVEVLGFNYGGRRVYNVNQFGPNGGWQSPITHSLEAACLAADALAIRCRARLMPCFEEGEL